MINYSHCPICNSPDLTPSMDITDHFASKESFKLIHCKTCQTQLTQGVPDENNIITYYKSDSYISHGGSKNNFLSKIYTLAQQLNFKAKRKILSRYIIDKNHLDYGCGTGAFLSYLHSNQWNVEGVEPSDYARQQQSNLSIPIHKNLSSIDPNKRFKSISLFHVLEHVHQLHKTLQVLINLLDNNGILLLALPNHFSHDADHYGQFWAGYDVPRHLYHFSQKSIHHLAKTFGLNIVATHPLKLDSYYVSLLSEQYMTGHKNYFKAIYHGFRSNQSAKNTGEYSSLIYILSK